VLFLVSTIISVVYKATCFTGLEIFLLGDSEQLPERQVGVLLVTKHEVYTESDNGRQLAPVDQKRLISRFCVLAHFRADANPQGIS
jgi:hypothetical protein